jgi:hypothetical protein
MFEILSLLKPDLKQQRDAMAASLRTYRKEDPAKARFLLARLRAGMAATERALQDNLFYSTPPTKEQA